MEEKINVIELLLERAADYTKTSYELVKLKTLSKSSDIFSSFIPNAVVIIFVASFLLFLNFGVAFWLGSIMGEIYYGFFAIAAFYVVIGIVVHFFLHKRIKRKIENYIIQKALK
jgi:fatty acid desaturase